MGRRRTAGLPKRGAEVEIVERRAFGGYEPDVSETSTSVAALGTR